MGIKITTLKKPDLDVLRDIDHLLKHLVHDPKTYKHVPMRTFREIVVDKNIVLVIARDGTRTVGIGLLLIVTKFRGRYGYVEDMMVDEEYRGRGIGKAIAEYLIELAKKRKIKTLELSTRPSRIPANNLYKKLGFQYKETNVYRMQL